MKFNESKCLIAYFSHKGMNYTADGYQDLKKGNTEKAAEIIHGLIGGDLLEIQAEQQYPFEYKECCDYAKNELTENARPKLTNQLPDMSRYDVLFVGYPCWWGTMPMPVWTFLESVDLKGKLIMPFCTHEGSAMGHSEIDLQKLLTESILHKGIPLRGSTVDESQKKIDMWLKAAEEIQA